MAPPRKSRSVNKRFTNTNDLSPEKDGVGSSKNKHRKKKLSNKLGSQWSKGELERFYEAYRKYGNNWKKVAAAVRNRSIEMVEALYNMNRAYLSLPEGTASVVGLIAMMTDHYNVLEESDSEKESNDAPGSRKPVKRKREKIQLSVSKDPVQSQSVTSSDGCLSLLKKRRIDGIQPRAVGKRTPRVPVYHSYKDDRETYVSPNKRSLKSTADANDDEAAHVALTLTRASQRGDSPLSQTPHRRSGQKSSLVQSRERKQISEKTRAKLHNVPVDEEFVEGSLESRGAENGEYARDTSSLLDMEGTSTAGVLLKKGKFYRKKEKLENIGNDQLDDGGEACSGTEEGLSFRSLKENNMERTNERLEQFSPTSQRKKSQNLFFGDEIHALNALQTLADLSLMMPTSKVESDSPVQLKGERMTVVKDDKSTFPEATSTSHKRNKVRIRGVSVADTSTSKKSKLGKDIANDTNALSESKEQLPFADKTWKRKHKSTVSKEKLSSCLSSSLVRRWFTFEWFYSALDYPWFAKREFVEYLNHVGLGNIPRLTRVEWSVIKSSLGKPRRFSEHFLHEERQKLEQYRESVRKHYSELRTGVRDGLPTDLARPLYVGQRVIAIHPKTREIHDGSVLTVDHDKCRIQFDRPELGVEFIMDVDCMPLNPLDNMPEALRRQIGARKASFITKEPQINGNSSFGGCEMHSSPVKADANHATSQTNIDNLCAQAACAQPSQLMQHQAKEADIHALSELKRALDKKETVLIELRNANNGILENQNGIECLKDPEGFKKHYATVSDTMLQLRQRNTYTDNSFPPWMKPKADFEVNDDLPSVLDNSMTQESRSTVIEIVKGSRLRAHAMLDAAFQAWSQATKEGKDAITRIGQALDSIDYQQLSSKYRLPVIRSQDQVNGSFYQHNQSAYKASEPLLNDASGPKLHKDSDEVDFEIPSELITSCVATLTMIQSCTERQYPPADVARILDSAVTSLQPCDPRNLPIYREIQMCMGRIKTQILALIPT